jgi:hypothetical protein
MPDVTGEVFRTLLPLAASIEFATPTCNDETPYQIEVTHDESAGRVRACMRTGAFRNTSFNGYGATTFEALRAVADVRSRVLD